MVGITREEDRCQHGVRYELDMHLHDPRNVEMGPRIPKGTAPGPCKPESLPIQQVLCTPRLSVGIPEAVDQRAKELDPIVVNSLFRPGPGELDDLRRIGGRQAETVALGKQLCAIEDQARGIDGWIHQHAFL
jgi:hypothetical protein